MVGNGRGEHLNEAVVVRGWGERGVKEARRGCAQEGGCKRKRVVQAKCKYLDLPWLGRTRTRGHERQQVNIVAYPPQKKPSWCRQRAGLVRG